MIYWFFGYPGIGKDYCAERLSKILRCPHLNADFYLNESERTKLLDGSFTSEDRLIKLRRICVDITEKLKNHTNLTVADSLPDEAARCLILDTFPDYVTLILVTAPKLVHDQRLNARQDHFFMQNHASKYIAQNWQPAESQHIVLNNDAADSEALDAQLKNIAHV